MITNEMLIIYILSVLVLALIAWIIKTEIRLKKAFAGKKAESLEEIIVSVVKTSADLAKNDARIQAELGDVQKRLRRSIQGVETVRFNPFRDSGGNHSFATAFINEDGDGVVLSSLYSRDRVNIFAKPIKNRMSEFELTEEEKNALAKIKN